MLKAKVETQKLAFAKDLEATDAEVVRLGQTIEQLKIKGNQLRGAIYALDLTLQTITADEAPVVPVEAIPSTEDVVAEAQAAVDASVAAPVEA